MSHDTPPPEQVPEQPEAREQPAAPGAPEQAPEQPAVPEQPAAPGSPEQADQLGEQLIEQLIEQLLVRELAWAEQALPLAPALPEVDLRVLAGALTALRSELRAETRAVRHVRDRIGEALATLDAGLARCLGQQDALVRRLDERGLDAAEHALFDIADRLDVTLRHTMLQPAPRPRMPWRWAGRVRARLASIEEGLRLTQARLEDHLTGLGIHRLPTIGRPFDPAAMEAVERVTRPDLPPGTVVDELAAGYRRGDRILRPARVVVTSGA